MTNNLVDPAAFDHVVFDLDGTVVDSAEDIIQCLEESYRLVLGTAVKVPKSIVGPPLPQMIGTLTPNVEQAECDAIISAFRILYDRSPLEHTHFFEGMGELLGALTERGVRVFIATNKPQKAAMRVLRRLSISNLTDIAASDSLEGPAREKREIVKYLVGKWELDDSLAVLVGDSKSDIAAAKSCGIKSVAVLYGYGNASSLESLAPDYIARTVKELRTILLDASIS